MKNIFHFLKGCWAIIRGRSLPDEECQELRELASAYLELDLSPDIKEQLDRHLKLCQGCSGFIESLHRTLDLLRGMPKETAPAEIRQNILRQIKQK